MSSTVSDQAFAAQTRERTETAAWARFVAADEIASFTKEWLILLAGRIEDAQAGVLLIAAVDDAPYEVIAGWPDLRHDLRYLGPAAERALTEKVGVVADSTEAGAGSAKRAHIAYPVEVAGRLKGAVVFDIDASAAKSLQPALREIHWASAWLTEFFGRQHLLESETDLARVETLNELIATAFQHRRLEPAAHAVANELVNRLDCERVSIGFEKNHQIELVAISNAANFDRKTDFARAIAEAMDEVLDLGRVMTIPAADADELGSISHAETARTLQAQALLSIPIAHDAETIGAITCERRDGPPFSDAEQRLVAAAGTMLGPYWAMQRAGERSRWQRWSESLGDLRRQILGPSHAGMKLVLLVLGIVLIATAMIETDHRVAARTVVEGSKQLAVVVPFDGFIVEAFVRAGDTVKANAPLARLDGRDLMLERQRWRAEGDQLQRQYQVAMADSELSALGVIGAQIKQSEAQLALTEENLARTTLTAPFDGIVVSGDLSQKLGVPVEKGDQLFEVAPIEGYRVVLQVDDRDIARLKLKQTGELVLSSQPDRALPFSISAITPVATQVDGRNVFRVEATLNAQNARLRPGMEGIGKIGVGTRSLLWIWTHRFVDSLRLALWNWMP